MTNVVKSSLALLALSAASVFPVQAQTFSKAFGKPTIRVNEITTLTFTIGGGLPLSFGFTDTLPVALQGVALQSNNCGGAPAITPTVISLTGALSPPGGCVMTVTVKGIGFDPGAVNTANGTGELDGFVAPANISVLVPDFTKAFTGPLLSPGPAPTIPRNGTTTLTFNLADNTGTDLPNFGWTDPLPSGFTVVSAPANACGGTVTAPVGGTSIALTGGHLLNGQSCILMVTVKASQSTSPSTPAANTVTGNGDLDTLTAVALVNVKNPTFSKSFAPATIALNQVSSLTFTISNDTGTNLINVGFTDLLPAGLVVDGAPTANLCALPVSGAPTNINVTGGTVNSGATCTLSVPVRATGGTPVVKQNNANGSGDLLGLPAPANLTVNTPTFTKTFGTSPIQIENTTTLTIVVDNTTGVALSNFSFNDPFPANIQYVSTVSTVGCVGIITPAAGSITLTGGSLAVGAKCTIIVNVKGSVLGGGTNTATGGGDLLNLNPQANITVNPGPPTFTKTFANPAIALNGTTQLTLNIGNHTGSPLANIGFNDPLPAGLTYVSTFSNGCNGTFTATPTTLTLTTASLPYPGSCSIVVIVKGTAVGQQNNTATGTGALVNINPQASVSVAAPTFTKVFDPNAVPQGVVSVMQFVIANPTAVTLTNLGFTDTLAANLTLGSLVSNTCNVAPVLAAPTITLSGVTLTPGTFCTVRVNATNTVSGNALVTIPNTALGTGDLLNINAFAELDVLGPIQDNDADIPFSKAFSLPSVPVNTNVNLTFTMTNKTGATVTTLGFTDALPAGMTVVNPPPSNNGCGGTLLAANGATMITLTNGVLANTLSCSITVTVRSSTPGTKNNIAIGKDALIGKEAPASILITQPVFSKSFSPNSTTVGTVVKLTFTIPNTTLAPIVVGFTDALPAGLAVASPLNFSLNGCGAATFAPVVGGTNLTLTNATVAATSTCTIVIDLVNTSPGAKHNTAIGTGAIAGQTAEADLDVFDAPTDAFQIRYFSNLNVGESYINLTNYGGSSTTALPVQNGNLCVNAYTYSPDEQLISCCSCQVTPNGLNSLQVKADLASNTLTPIIPSSVVVKLLATRQNGTCNPAIVTRGDLRAGLAAWGATLHEAPVTGGTPAGSYNMTETPFSRSTLSDAELVRMTQLCTYLQANGSGYGICKSCKVGGLGANAK